MRARQRVHAPLGPLHLTRRSDLLDLDIPSADIGLYDTGSNPSPTPHNPPPQNP